MRFSIPALRVVAKAARKHAESDAELAAALAELDLADRETDERHAVALRERGLDCVMCGRRFLPLQNDYSACCSIGCRLK